jgi:hypothetical protein
MSMLQSRKCLICKGGKKNDCLYWHKDSETGELWVWCQGVCQRGYSLQQYCAIAGIDLEEFLKCDFTFEESKPNEVRAISWPSSFVPLSDPRAANGVEYVRSRGLTMDGDMYYDLEDNGIVFPYYYDKHFCGAQVRFIEERIGSDGEPWKITTLPGTRLGLLFYGWNQSRFMGDVKGVIVTEGAFNALSIMQSLNATYGGISKNPWRVMACSGSGGSAHHIEALQELMGNGLKVVIAPDTDPAGFKMLHKFISGKAMTHFALTGDTEKDWNDMLKQLGHKELAKFFLSKIEKRPDEQS